MEAGGGECWAVSHAALPFVDPDVDGGPILYFSPRDGAGRAHIAKTRLRVADGAVSVLDRRPDLVLAPGARGAFDDSGVTNSCVVRHNSSLYLYFSGWTLGVTVPFYFYVGLAVSEDGGRTFARASPAPILGRSEVDPFLTASPSVLVEDDRWRMWYVSCVEWGEDSDRAPRHRYHVKYAESGDGVHWTPTGIVAIDFRGDEEYAIGRPCVVREGSTYRMWFCARGEAYRLGYAESTDGLSWTRMDSEADLDPSAEGWDSEMIAYPWLFEIAGTRYLVYNGNGYGRTGIGIASANIE